MLQVKPNNIPEPLKALKQWVLWKMVVRGNDDKPTKVPFQANGETAKANDPQTWGTFSDIIGRYSLGGYDGIGFEFAESDQFCGIDLDGCRDKATGRVAEWAREIIVKLSASYAEVSPSETGVKIFAIGQWGDGKKVTLPDMERICDKMPGIEIYDRGRYFAVTGWKLAGTGKTPAEASEQIAWLKASYWKDNAPIVRNAPDWRSDAAVIDRARKYLARMPPSVSGQSGHNAAFHVACVLVKGFALGEHDAMNLMREFNQVCQPQWSEKELAHKIRQAGKSSGQTGYLRNAAPERWEQISVPQYAEPAPSHEARVTTVTDAASEYLESIKNGTTPLLTTGIPDLDYAIGGGLERGELVILGARPSHGKSAVGLQCCHTWARQGISSLIISEEMNSRMIGRRAMQYITALPQEHWTHCLPDLAEQLDFYKSRHKRILIAEGCGKVEIAAAEIVKHVKESQIECVIVDYAQLLGGQGRTRYEQITNVSITLRKLASELKLILVLLCQLSRGIESRSGEFLPVMSDLKESGQLEQDADVIIFACWPHRLNQDEPHSKYQFYVAKNRNRSINQNCVTCVFNPERQMFTDAKPELSWRQMPWQSEQERTERDRHY